MKYYKGSISIYFAICIILIISVILSVTEIARMTCQKLYLQIATDTSIDSMLSLYHRKLYEKYNIYGVEYLNDDLLTKEYLTYIKPYFYDDARNKNIGNWYIAKINEEQIDLNKKLLIDDTFLEKEIIEYMNYKGLGKAIEFLGKEININDEADLRKLEESAGEIFDEVRKSTIYSEIYSKYFDFADSIKDFEKAVKEANDDIGEAKRKIGELSNVTAGSSLSSAENINKKVEKVISSIDNLGESLDECKEKISDFKALIERKKVQYENDKLSEKYEFDDEIVEFIEDEFSRFEAYVSDGSEINMILESKLIEISSITDTIKNIKNNIDYYVDAFKDIEDEIAEERKSEERDNDYINDLNEEKRNLGKDLSEYVKEIKDELREINIENLDIDISDNSRNNEESSLKELVNYKNGVLLNIVLDENAINNLDRTYNPYNLFDISSLTNKISIEKILLGEYEIDKFNYYGKNDNQNLEVEQLISGKNTNMDNLESTIDKMLLIRIAMNVLHIYKSTEKRQEVRNLTYAIFGGFSRLLAETMFLLTITAWGTVQGLYDMKKLLKGYKVNFMHNDDSWSIDINEIISIARNKTINIDEDDDDTCALSYKDYLRLVLLNTDQEIINERMAGIIEYNLKSEQQSFDFGKMISGFNVSNEFHCKHFFTNFIFTKAKDVRLFNEYLIRCDGYKSFIK